MHRPPAPGKPTDLHNPSHPTTRQLVDTQNEAIYAACTATFRGLYVTTTLKTTQLLVSLEHSRRQWRHWEGSRRPWEAHWRVVGWYC